MNPDGGSVLGLERATSSAHAEPRGSSSAFLIFCQFSSTSPPVGVLQHSHRLQQLPSQQSPRAVLREVPKASLDALGCRCAQGMRDKGRWKQRKIMGLKEKKSKGNESLYEHQRTVPLFIPHLQKDVIFW